MRTTSPLDAGAGKKRVGGGSRYAPLLAMIGAGMPWVAYDQLIADPSDFWTLRGAVFMATAVLGVISVALAWEVCRGDRDKRETGRRDSIGL
jgi:hypothetical protein